MEYYAERRLKRLGLLDDQGKTTWDGELSRVNQTAVWREGACSKGKGCGGHSPLARAFPAQKVC